MPSLFAAGSSRKMETRFATVHYADDAEIEDFLWRISGKRLGGEEAAELTRNRVDEIVERVESVLDMHPLALHFGIFLETESRGEGAIAYYSHESRSITALSNRITDGVLAHEIAHAVLNSYFGIIPPEKAQEILAQYVDQHLWSEVA